MSWVKRMPPAKIRTYRVGCPYCARGVAELLLHPGDTISLSYPRASTGVFKKKWTGEYSSAPVSLWNNTTQRGWRL